MAELTILTPSFNRKKELHVLFDSLCCQSDKDFEWVIVDDGSTDGTFETAQVFRAHADFPVKYYQKENGGKHTALNFALKRINTPLVFIVDSDDRLTENAVRIIHEKYRAYKHETDLCGFSFLRQRANGAGYLTKPLQKDNIKSTYCERLNHGLEGDMAEVWYTEKLRAFPFPEFKGEKFLGEDTVWVKLSGKYKIRFFNQAVYISDYLNSGLTLNRRRHNIQSPNGCVARAQAFLDSDVDFKHKIKAMLQYFIYGRFAGRSQADLFKATQYTKLALLCAVPAQFLFEIWKRKFKTVKK